MAGKPGAKASGIQKASTKKLVAKVATVDVVVTVEEAHRTNIAAVVRQLKAAGLIASETLESAGVVIGRVAHDSLTSLKAVAGVKAVEASGGVQIAPPDAEVQ